MSSGNMTDRHRISTGAAQMLSDCEVLGIELDTLAIDQAAWSQATFGTDAERGPIGPLRHLAKEAEEAAKSFIVNDHASGDQGDVREEFADCLLLVLDASRRARITPLELIRAAAEKMVKNKARKWSKPTADQPVEHVRDGEKKPAAVFLVTTGDGDYGNPWAVEGVFSTRAEAEAYQLAYQKPIPRGDGTTYTRECDVEEWDVDPAYVAG